MKLIRIILSNTTQFRLYLFLSALVINFFLEIITIVNGLSIHYFFHATPLIIRIDLLPESGNTFLWIGSFFFVYIAKDAIKGNPKFRQILACLNAALVGSFLLTVLIFLATLGAFIEPALELLFDQLFFLGYVISFIGSLLALFTMFTTMPQNRSLLRLFLIYLFSLLVPIEIWSLFHWLAYPFDIMSYLGFAWRGAFMELQLFYISYPLIFWLLIAFLFSWIWVPSAKFVANKIRQKQWIPTKAFPLGTKSGVTLLDNETENIKSSTRQLVPVAVLLVSLFIGVFIAYYQYINPEPGLVGTDSLGYYNSLIAMLGKDLFGATQLAAKINSARILYHLLLYFFQNLTQLPSIAIIRSIPVATTLVNTLSVFWFVRIGEKRALVASIAALLSVFSFNTTIGAHAGLFANWLAVALGFVMFGLVLRFHEKKSLQLLFAAILASALVFFIHYWSLLFFLAVLSCYVFLTYLERGRRNTKLVAVMLLFASATVLVLFLNDLISRFFASYSAAQNASVTEAFVLFWNRLPIFIDSWFFGALANPVLIALSIVGIVGCFYQKTNFSRLLISWTIVGSLLSVFVSPVGTNMDQWLTWRTLYLIPFQIPAALGLFSLAAKLGSFSRNSVHSDERNHGNYVHVKPSISLPMNDNIGIIFLIIDYVVSALLLTFDFPILLVLVLFNFLVLTFIFHFRVFERNTDSFLVFIFVLFVTLVLFNYTLRTLAPLAVQRMQI